MKHTGAMSRHQDITIRRAAPADAGAIAAIYNRYVEDTEVSFETEPVPVAEMAQRIADRLARYDWIVAERQGHLIGYAYYGQFRTRAAYDHVVESTVYLAEDAVGLGLGRRLYTDLIASAQGKGFREIIGVIALPNDASEQLHERMGFVLVGRLPKVGHKFGRYIDVSYWQWSLPDTDSPADKHLEETI